MQPSEGLGHFPPMMHRHKAPDQTSFSRAHNPEAIARAKGAGTGAGAGAGGKSNLAGQIIPVYGFGILLYILYILFKVGGPSRRLNLWCKTVFSALKPRCVFCRSHLRGTASRRSAGLLQFAPKTRRGRSVSTILTVSISISSLNTHTVRIVFYRPPHSTQPTLSWLSCRRN